MPSWLLAINVLSARTLLLSFALSTIFVLLLLIRFPVRSPTHQQYRHSRVSPRYWLISRGIAIVAGALLGLLVSWLAVVVFDSFGGPVTSETWYWATALFAGLGLVIVNLFKSRLWRKIIAILAIPAFLVSAGLGINASFGLNSTVASVLGISLEQKIALPKVDDGPVSKKPLWQSWVPPKNMPAQGKTGIEMIPPTVSGFQARPAGIYLPPAALTAHPPKLPFYLLMMGQPGLPDPQYVAGILDNYASKHDGLAPIVVVADQIGPAQADTLCVNSQKYGRVQDYLQIDVVNWAKQNLNISAERQQWTVAGYSNGGQCAISMAVKFPKVWGNVVDISGEEFPGAEKAAQNLAQIFNGDAKAYEAEKPINIMAKHRFPDTTAIFTAGANDPVYVGIAYRVSQAAKAAGMTVTNYLVPQAGHVGVALTGGLAEGFKLLYPRLGLSP